MQFYKISLHPLWRKTDNCTRLFSKKFNRKLLILFYKSIIRSLLHYKDPIYNPGFRHTAGHCTNFFFWTGLWCLSNKLQTRKWAKATKKPLPLHRLIFKSNSISFIAQFFNCQFTAQFLLQTPIRIDTFFYNFNIYSTNFLN